MNKPVQENREPQLTVPVKARYSLYELILCAMFAALVAIGGFIKIPLGPIPLTMQFLFTNVAVLLLGRRLGTTAVIVYVVIGLLGIPVFTQGGGPAYIFQPTFGYLLGFIAGAWLAGLMIERATAATFWHYLLAGFGNMLVVYACGVPYFYLIANYYLGTPVGVKALLVSGFLLTVPSDILSCCFSAFLAKRLRPLLRKH